MANLKAGTLIGGNLIWNHGNLPLSVSGNTLFINGNKIYTTVDRPQPGDVGAVAKAGDTMTGTLTAEKNIIIKGAAPILTFHETDVDKRFMLVSDGDSIRLNRYTTSVTNENLIWNWRSNASQIDGGQLELINPITRSVQGEASNSLARRDFVISEDAKQVAKTGDTMTGKLTLNYTSAIKVPVGTTAQGSGGGAGDFRYNTDEVSYEGHDGTEWQPIGLGRIKYNRYSTNFTAVKSKGHLLDTTKAGLIATLPAGARESDFVIIGDGANNASKNPFYIAGYNGDRIVVNTDNCMLLFSFVGGKWVITNGIGENGAIDFPGNLALNGISLTKTLPINETALVANTWTDTGITVKSLADVCGTGYLYGCNMESTASDGGLGQYHTQLGFITSGYNASTNSTAGHEIPITVTSHSTGNATFKLRWLFSPSASASTPKLQVLCNIAGTLKFRLHVRKLM